MTQHLSSVALVALTLASCRGSEAPTVSLPAAAAATATPTQVETLVATATEVAAPVHATGTSEPLRQADLAPAMAARIERLYVREGQAVKLGQPLVELDGRTAELTAQQAHAAAAAGLAQANQLDADVARLAPLAARGSVAASRVEQLESQRTAARAQARAAASAASAASRVASNAVLRAPFAGTIVALPHEVGEMATSGGSLARLVDLSQVEIHVRVAARDLGALRTGDAATVRFPQLGVTARGTLARIGLEVDPATSTAEVVAVVPNPDGALRGGLFAELTLTPSRQRPAIVVPRTAVSGTGAQASVFVVADGTATRRAVQIAPFDDLRVEIVGGLPPNTTVVAGQLDRVRDGALVATVVPPPSPVTTAGPAVEAQR